jgi:hypothetical protein
VSIAPPPYLLEYRAARALMAMGNIGPAKLIDMLDSGDAFLFHGDLAFFEKCPHCKDLPNSHQNCFVKKKTDDVRIRGMLAEKLIEGGLNRPLFGLAEPTIAMIAAASRLDYSCVLGPAVLWDNLGACKLASVPVVALDDFLAEVAAMS